MINNFDDDDDVEIGMRTLIIMMLITIMGRIL